MGISLVLLLAASTSGLTVDTDSPDALCPPLDEAREVIASRVGRIQGGDYRARYRVVFDAQKGRNTLELELRDGSDLVLEREIPLEAADCSDAALAMALVLERFFASAFELTPQRQGPTALPASPERAVRPDRDRGDPLPTDLEGPAAAVTELETPSSAGSSSAVAERDVAAQVAPGQGERRLSTLEDGDDLAPHLWWLRGHLDIAQGPLFQVGLGVELSSLGWWSLLLDTNFQIFRNEVESNGYSLGTLRHGIGLVPSYVWRATRWVSFQVGPHLGAQLQVAQLLGEEPSRKFGPHVRVLPATGAQLGVDWRVTKRLRLGLLGRFIYLLPGVSFAVEQNQGQSSEVLSLPSLTWDAGVSWSLRL